METIQYLCLGAAGFIIFIFIVHWALWVTYHVAVWEKIINHLREWTNSGELAKAQETIEDNRDELQELEQGFQVITQILEDLTLEDLKDFIQMLREWQEERAARKRHNG